MRRVGQILVVMGNGSISSNTLQILASVAYSSVLVPRGDSTNTVVDEHALVDVTLSFILLCCKSKRQCLCTIIGELEQCPPNGVDRSK